METSKEKVLKEKVESNMDENIVLIKSSELVDRLKRINSKAEDIINYILEKTEIQSQDMYVMLKKASRKSIIAQELIYISAIISIDIKKNEKRICTYNIPGYFLENENEIYISYGMLFNLCGECVSTKRIVSCSLAIEVKEKYNKINDLRDNKGEIILNAEENLLTDIKAVERMSVCMVVEHNEEIRLHRLADINDENQIIPFIPDSNLPKIFENRNLLYKKDGSEQIGYIGVWNWMATSSSLSSESEYIKDYIESWYRAEYELIEVVIISENKSLEFVIEEIKRGRTLEFLSPQIFFCVHVANGNYEGVLCQERDLKKEGEIYRLKENVFSLPKYTIFSEDIVRLEDRSFYKTFHMGEPERKIIIKNEAEVIKDILLHRASWSFMKQHGISRKDWQQFKGILGGLPDNSLYQEVANRCECSEERAEQYVTDFIVNANQFIDGQDVGSELLHIVIENNEELKKRCEEIISQKWKNEYEKEINQAKEEFQIIRNQTNSEVSEREKIKEAIDREILHKKEILCEIEKDIETANKECTRLENEIKEYETLGDEVEKKIAKRMEDAKKNVADFICEMAFCTPIQTSQAIEMLGKSEISNIYTVGMESQDELDVLERWQYVIDILQEELHEAGIADDFLRDFAIYLYAAYRMKMPILLAGPCGSNIANAFSMTLYGKTAGVFECNNEYRADEVQKMLNSDDEIVIIKNPFNAMWVNNIMDLLLPAKKQYFLVVPYTEDLLIEPNGLINYMMPILTEMFVDKVPTNQFIGSKMAIEFKNFVKEDVRKNIKVNNYTRVFKEFKINKMVANRWQEIIELYHGMSGKESVEMDYLMVLFPCAYITEQGSRFIEHIEKAKNLSADIKNNIKSFLGEEE